MASSKKGWGDGKGAKDDSMRSKQLTPSSTQIGLFLKRKVGWRRLRGYGLLSKIIAGVKFKDGEEITTKNQVA